MNITKFAIPEIIFGQGSLRHLPGCARRHGAKKILFVSDHGLEKAGWVQYIKDILDADGLPWVYFNNVCSNPRNFQIEEGAEFYREKGADVIVAMGGGSALDVAKGIAILASNGGRLRSYEGANRIMRPLPPMICIPSTAGSGSDISQFAIITDVQRQIKMSIISRTLMPNMSIIDPLILKTKSKELIIASAVDALSHAVESYVSKLASPFSETHSLRAIALITQNLMPALETQDLKYLENLSIASTSSGMAFSNASLGIEHSLAHSLGGVFDVEHGLVHPILLVPVMRFNLPYCEKKMANIGEIVLGKRLGSDKETAIQGIDKLQAFFNNLGVPTHLRKILPSQDSLPQLCSSALKDACTLTNPRQAEPLDLIRICQEVW